MDNRFDLQHFDYDDTFHLNIYDTWGLEPDKSEEWKELIVKEVQEHDKRKGY